MEDELKALFDYAELEIYDENVMRDHRDLIDNFENRVRELIGNPLDALVRKKIYGVVEWINENPLLDGMEAFKDKESALKYCEGRLSGQVDKDIFVKHTIIGINFTA